MRELRWLGMVMAVGAVPVVAQSDGVTAPVVAEPVNEPAVTDPAPLDRIAESRKLLAEGRSEDAYRAAKDAVDAGDGSVSALGQLGLAAMAAGQIDEAIAAFSRAAEAPIARGSSYYNLACALAVRGEIDAAFDALGKAADHGYRDQARLDSDEDLEVLRDDPRMAAIKERMAQPVGR